MGSRQVNVAVADAGPLIHLNEIGCFSLLDIFEALHIPDAVWSETVGQERVSQTDVLGLVTFSSIACLKKMSSSSYRKMSWEICMPASVNVYTFANG